MKYLFGPVNSRRLGLSLGIDLVPFKTCSCNCIYCECGRTTNITVKTAEYVPTDSVITELKDFLADRPELDVITFAGSGEPTLHSGIKEIIIFLKKDYPEYKISVLTNGTLLYIKKIRKSILDADIIIPSLDAASENVFNRINRPANDISVTKTIKGLIALREEFKNIIILEIFIVPGLNDNENELDHLKSACKRIGPDIIQLNTLDRPGSEKWLKPPTQEKLQGIKRFFEPLYVEIIKSPENRKNIQSDKFLNIYDAVISTISRRPSTLKDLTVSLQISREDILKTIQLLLKKGAIKEESLSRGTFYTLKI